MYKEYCVVEDEQQVLNQFTNMYEEALSKGRDINVSNVMNREYILNNVQIKLINAMNNREYLEGLVHRPFEDLSAVFYCNIDKEQQMSFKITKSMSKSFEFKPQELWKHAYENTKKNMQFKCQTMGEILSNITGENEYTEIDGMDQMYVFTGEKGINGASVMLYPEMFEKLSKELDSDLYILPSSMHEVIAIKSNNIDAESLADMVIDVNETELQDEEKLSNQVYEYKKGSLKIKKVTTRDELFVQRNMGYKPSR